MIPAKTPAGLQVLKDRSVALSPRQRTALILIDGKRGIAEVLRQAPPRMTSNGCSLGSCRLPTRQRLCRGRSITHADGWATSAAPRAQLLRRPSPLTLPLLERARRRREGFGFADDLLS